MKGYAKHEKELFEEVTKLRNCNYSGMDNNTKMDINNKLTSGLEKLFAVAENYPELMTDSNFLHLQETLNKIETDIANARKYYNGTVRNLNNFTE